MVSSRPVVLPATEDVSNHRNVILTKRWRVPSIGEGMALPEVFRDIIERRYAQKTGKAEHLGDFNIWACRYAHGYQ
jgi:hypothetical protein